MSFGRSVFLLFTMVCAVLVPVFLGHGLASHGGAPFAIGGGLFLIAAVSVALIARRGGRDGYAARTGEGAGEGAGGAGGRGA